MQDNYTMECRESWVEYDFCEAPREVAAQKVEAAFLENGIRAGRQCRLSRKWSDFLWEGGPPADIPERGSGRGCIPPGRGYVGPLQLEGGPRGRG